MVLHALASFIALLGGLNFWGWQEPSLGLGLGLAWLILTSWLIGGRAQALAQDNSARLIFGLIITLAMISVVGTLLFYINLWQPIVIFTLAIIWPLFGTNKKIPAHHISKTEPVSNLWQRGTHLFAIGLYFGVSGSLLLTFCALTTQEAIRTPWSIVPPIIFAGVALTAGLALFVAQTATTPLWLVPGYVIFLSLLIVIYPLGYGFDIFIHQASEKMLSLTGTISPKPFYYLGQYTSVTFLAQLLGLSVVQIDNWLLPLLASLALPFSLAAFINNLFIPPKWRLTLALAPLFFAPTAFTYTTPQGLAYLWFVITCLMLASRLLGAKVPTKILWLTGLAAFVTHPLAGLPGLGILTLWWLKEYGVNFKYRRRWRLIAAVSTALCVPMAFALLTWFQPSAASIKFSGDILTNLKNLFQTISYQLPFWPRFIDVPDAIYLWGRPLTLIFLVLAGLGYWQAKRQQYSALKFIGRSATLPGAGFLVFTLLFTFPNLPDNEQNFYSIRLWDITLLLLWPLTILGIYWLSQNMIDQLRRKLSWLIIGSLLLTASFYLTYPRFDIWHHATAYNTTAYDVMAVRLVENAAGGADYVVLANQAVAAAAVKEFGFAKYYAGHFYYPIPTGTNPLYQVYLNATERGLPMREIIKPASNLGVGQVFLILNRYWADYDTLSKVAKAQADEWWEVADGRITIYRYAF